MTDPKAQSVALTYIQKRNKPDLSERKIFYLIRSTLVNPFLLPITYPSYLKSLVCK
jgi:hypothetical protein